MTKIEKEVQRFIKNYSNETGDFFRVVIPDGHGGQIRRQGFLTKADATDFCVQKYLKVLSQSKGVKIITTSLSFKDYAASWLESKKRNGLAVSSAMRYEDEIKIRLIPFFGSFKIGELEKLHLRNYIRELQTGETGTSIVNYSVAVFKSIIRQAEIEDLVAVKGLTTVPTPKHRKADPRFWDQIQANYFLNATKEHPLNDLWKLALFSGLRAGEVAGLKWDAIHLDKSFGSYSGAIEVRRNYNQKTRQIEETTKNGDRRTVPILPEVKEILLRLQKDKQSEFVFGGAVPLDSSHFNRQLQSALKKLDQIPKIPFHGLRHSFCSYLDATGMSRRIVSEIMGHRDLNTTNRYSHVNNQMLGYEVSRWLETQNQQKTNKLVVACV